MAVCDRSREQLLVQADRDLAERNHLLSFQIAHIAADSGRVTLAAGPREDAASRPIRVQLLRGVGLAAVLVVVLVGVAAVTRAISNADQRRRLAQQQIVAGKKIYAADGLRDECDHAVTRACAQAAAKDTNVPVGWIAEAPAGLTSGGMVVTIGTKYRIPDPDPNGYTGFAADTGFNDRGSVNEVDLLTKPTGITVHPNPQASVMATVTADGDQVVILQVSPHAVWAQWTRDNVLYVLIASDLAGPPPLRLAETLLPNIRYTSP